MRFPFRFDSVEPVGFAAPVKSKHRRLIQQENLRFLYDRGGQPGALCFHRSRPRAPVQRATYFGQHSALSTISSSWRENGARRLGTGTVITKPRTVMSGIISADCLTNDLSRLQEFGESGSVESTSWKSPRMRSIQRRRIFSRLRFADDQVFPSSDRNRLFENQSSKIANFKQGHRGQRAPALNQMFAHFKRPRTDVRNRGDGLNTLVLGLFERNGYCRAATA